MLHKFLKIVAVSMIGLVTPTVLAQDTDASPAFVMGDLVTGSGTAPVEVIEYGSLTCSHCGHFSNEVLPKLKADYIDTGKVRFVFRNFVRDRYDMAIAVISRCTSEPETAKGLISEYFLKQKDWMTAENPYVVIGSIANEAGVSEEDVAACLSDRSMQEELLKMRQTGTEAYEIDGVPFLIVNGQPIKGHSFEALKAAIEAAQ